MTKDNQRPSFVKWQEEIPTVPTPSEQESSLLLAIACVTFFPMVYLLGRITLFLLA